MSTLLDVPPEVMDTIAMHLLPHSIIPFIVTCKTIYIRCMHTVQKHREYQARWTKLSHEAPHRNDFLHLLLRIVRDPLGAEYVQELHLWDRRERSETCTAELHGAKLCIERGKNAEPFDANLFTRDMQSLKNIVLQSNILPEAGIDVELWWEAIEWEMRLFNPLSPDYNPLDTRQATWHTTLITTLLLLPGLKELALPDMWTGLFDEESDDGANRKFQPGALRKLVRYLVQRARNHSPESRFSPLSKLEILHPDSTSGYDWRSDFQNFEDFLPLPNLHSVYAVSKVAAEDIPFDWHPPNHAINMSLRRLELWSCVVDGEGLQAILSRTPLLEVFKYKHETKWQGLGSEWEADPFVDALVDCVGSTLKELVISVDIEGFDLSEPISDLKGLSKLEVLECDPSFLMGMPVKTKPLSDILPPCIKSVIAYADANRIEDYNLKKYLSGIKDRKENGFPDFESLVVFVWNLWGSGEPTKMDLGPLPKSIVEAEGASWVEESGCAKEGIGWDAEFRRRFSAGEDDAYPCIIDNCVYHKM